MSCRKLLVLYTGGTVGMQMSATGLAPASGFEARLRSQQALDALPLPEWVFDELLPPIDSANMNQHNWLAMVSASLEWLLICPTALTTSAEIFLFSLT